MVRIVLALLIVPLIVGQTAVANDDVETIDASKLQRFAMDPFEESEGQNPIFYTEWSGILERFGEPPKTAESIFGDRTSDAIMTSHLLKYDGVTFGITESEDKNHSWLQTIDITGNAYSLKFGIEIGTAFTDLVALLQIPPPRFRTKSTRLNLGPEIRGHWAGYQDESGQPKYVYANISLSFYFDAEDHVDRIVLGVYSD